METLLTPVFLIDFLLRLAKSRPRAAYLVHAFGWADLLAIVPLLRIFRLFRVVAVVRQLQAQGPARIADDLLVNRAAATFFTTIFLVIVVLEVSGMLILDAESGIPGANRACSSSTQRAGSRAPTSRRRATPSGGAT